MLAIMRRLSSARTLDEIMTVVSAGVRALLQADGATFVLREGERCFYAEEDAVSPLWRGRRFPLSACISGWCMLNRQSVAVADIYQDDRIPADTYRPTFVRSLAMAPVGRDEPVAALGAYWAEVREPRAEEVELLQDIADAAALAVANVQLRQGAPQPAPSPAPAARPDAVAPPPEPRARGRRSLQGYLARLRREGPTTAEAYAFAGACVAVATLLRLAVKATGVHGLAIYSTYYPAAVLAMMVGGRRAGLFAAGLGGLAAYYFFMPPLYEMTPLTVSEVLNLALYAGSCGLIILIVDRYQRAVSRLTQEDARHLTLAREQHHRLRNALFVIEAIVRQSLRGQPERAKTINQRIRASQAAVEDSPDEAALSLRELLAAELQPYDLARFDLDLEDQRGLPAKARNLASLAVHELATNALKYGALSVPDGRVSVAARSRGGRTTIEWREAGGPPVKPPKRRGYGTTMLRRLVEGAGGSLAIHYAPSGVTAEISVAA
jgi:two-component sensor histidine kinase